jgi:hypothetical protein
MAATADIEDKILEIINDGINDIVIEIQQTIGADENTRNRNVKNIVQLLNEISNYIYNLDQYKKRDIYEHYSERNIVYLDDPRFYDERDFAGADEVGLDEKGIKKVENRLINCQILEQLYQNKHKELMDTFSFLLNLFNKYKNAIKLLLFLIKNLKAKGSKYPNIRLPKTIIPDISGLLTEQAEIQAKIAKMENDISRDPSNNLLRHADREDITKNLIPRE